MDIIRRLDLYFGIILLERFYIFFISNSFVYPIRELETATSQLQLGNLEAKVSVDSNDEIGF